MDCVVLSRAAWASPQQPAVEHPYFGVHVVDEATGRGVPLVELKTVNENSHWTDSEGWIAFDEPDLMDEEV
jgi:hypothetical protein